jgi:hypothetical protein
MSPGQKILGCFAVLAVLSLAVPSAWAHPELARQTKAPCSGCHANAWGGSALSDAGKAYKASGKAPAAGPQVPAYVGNAKCKMCHMKEFKAWSATPHASALTNLEKADAKVTADMAAKLKVTIKGTAA